MSSAPEEVGLGPNDVYFADERLQALIGPGAPFEVEPLVLDGVPLRAFIRAPRRPLIVARFGDRVAGYALLSAREGGRTARIYSIAVDPAQGRRGVGRALLQACERYARAHGREALRLEVRYDNPAAIALYEKTGFRPIGRYPGYYEDGAVALRFEKRLAPASDATAA